jgi:hypothetical protein
MKRTFLALAAATLSVLASAWPAVAFAPETTAATKAIDWLRTQESTDGTVGADATRTEEAIVGLTANGATVTSFSSNGNTPIDSLRVHIATEEKTAGNIGNLVMAVSAVGMSATAFAGRNLLQDLQCRYDAASGVYNTQVFNDALAVMALPSGSAPTKATTFLIDQQQADGGWEFQAGFGSDTNTTAVVVMTLLSAGNLPSTAQARALAYFKLHQKSSGGFEYSAPFAPPGDSDPNSDALVIEALLATGQDPTAATWSLDGKNAVNDLLSFQYSSGGFGFERPGSSASSAPDAASTTQALPALAAKFLPIRRTEGVLPSGCSTATATTSPTATSHASPVATRALAQTGSSPLPLAVIGLSVALLGWRLRRRTRV